MFHVLPLRFPHEQSQGRYVPPTGVAIAMGKASGRLSQTSMKRPKKTLWPPTRLLRARWVGLTGTTRESYSVRPAGATTQLILQLLLRIRGQPTLLCGARDPFDREDHCPLSGLVGSRRSEGGLKQGSVSSFVGPGVRPGVSRAGQEAKAEGWQ